MCILYSKFCQLVFVDELGCDGRAGYRSWGWYPKGSFPVQIIKFGRGKRWHILPAYAQDGIMLRTVYQGSTDSDFFKDFIAHLLHHCGRYPGPKSVIVMDNASWHPSEKNHRDVPNGGVKAHPHPSSTLLTVSQSSGYSFCQLRSSLGIFPGLLNTFPM